METSFESKVNKLWEIQEKENGDNLSYEVIFILFLSADNKKDLAFLCYAYECIRHRRVRNFPLAFKHLLLWCHFSFPLQVYFIHAEVDTHTLTQTQSWTAESPHTDLCITLSDRVRTPHCSKVLEVLATVTQHTIIGLKTFHALLYNKRSNWSLTVSKNDQFNRITFWLIVIKASIDHFITLFTSFNL